MNSLKKIFFGKDYFLILQLIICIVFIIYFVKLNIKIVKTSEEEKKLEVKKIKLLSILDSLKNLPFYYKTTLEKSKLAIVNLESNKPLKFIPIKPLGIGDTNTKKYRNSMDTGIKLNSFSFSPKIESNTEIKYQADLRDNLIKLNEYENIMLVTARIKKNYLKESTFSMQEINIEDNGDNTSKLINFNCIKSNVTDSIYDFIFIENKIQKPVPLDPLNYDRDFKVSIKGTFNSQNIFCVLYWKDINGRPFSARIRMMLKK